MLQSQRRGTVSPMWSHPLALSVHAALLAVASAAPSQGALGDVDFERDVAPILAARCIECHGPEKQKQGLRLDLRAAAFAGGDSGEPGFVPGQSLRSEVFRRIDPEDEFDVMPPSGEPLTAGEVALVGLVVLEGMRLRARGDAGGL